MADDCVNFGYVRTQYVPALPLFPWAMDQLIFPLSHGLAWLLRSGRGPLECGGPGRLPPLPPLRAGPASTPHACTYMPWSCAPAHA